jgi:hypothetical protein
MYREEEIANTQVAGDERIPDASILGSLLCRTERMMQIILTFMKKSCKPGESSAIWVRGQLIASCADEYITVTKQ